MKLKRILAMVLCIAMVLSTMSISVFAADEESNVITVESTEAFYAALEADEANEILFNADITIDTKITVPDDVVIDLNNNTLYVNVENSYYNNVTIKNGDIVLGKDDVHVCDGYFLVNDGKTLVLNSVKVSSAPEGIKGYAVFHLKTGANLDLVDSELNICDNEYEAGYIVYAGESTATVDITGTTVIGQNVNGIVHASTDIDNSVFTIAPAVEHGINRSAVKINDSLVTISGGTGRGITAQHGDLIISGDSVVNISDMGEATIELRGDKNLTVEESATVTVDVAVNNTTSGTISGKVTVEGTTDTPGGDDSDVEEDIILINTAEELAELRDNVNAGTNYYEGKYVKLNADIDLENTNWTPIGSASADHGFMGNFDGNGHTIFNLTIEDPALDGDGYAYAGLFGVTEGTDKDNQNIIKNLTVENVTISTTGHIVAAAIAYPYYTIVENVKVCGNIDITGGEYTAGVLAYTRRCVDASDLFVEGAAGSTIGGSQVVGGIISDIQMNGGLIANYSNFNASGVTISGTKNVGGISGIIASQTLDTCSVKDVTLDCDDARVGTVAGCLGGVSTISDATVENVSGASALIGGTYDDGKSVEAKIGDKYYATLATAISAAESGDTVTLLCDVNAVDIPDGVTLHTNGYKCIQAKGTWGGIDWTLDAEGTLTIAPTEGTPIADANSGKTYEVGAWREAVRYDSTGEGKAIEGWPYDRTKVKKLIIEEGVTSIGSFTAQGLTNLTGEVVIPSTVTYIGQEAFQKSTFTKLIFAEGGTEELCIAQGAFKNLIIEEVSLPSDRPVHLHAWVFNNCLNLKSATLPATLVSVHGTNHIDYFKDFNAHSNPTWTQSSDIFAYNKNMETITFGSEEVKNMFFAAQGNQNSIDSIGDVEIKVVVPAVAQIGETKYVSLADAVASAKDGEEITLLADITDCVGIKVESGKKNTLDLNGYTISGTCVSSQQYMFIVANEATMTIKDSSETQTGKITYAGNNSTGWIVDVEGKLVLESGTLELTGTWSIGYAVDVRPNAWGTAYTEETSFVMNGGKIVSSDGAVRVASSSADNYDNIAASFTMNGGEIEAAWDGVFVQQSNAVWDVLNVTVNDGTIKSALNPIRFYGPAATSYVNGEDCVDIKLNGGTLTYTGTETQTWLVENIIRLGGGVTADDFMKDSSVIASTAFADANVEEGYKWVESNGVYTLEKEETANPFKDAPLFLAGIPNETVDGVTYHPVYIATSIDSLNYKKVGFDYIFQIFDPETGNVTFTAPYTTETSEVYSSISDATTTYTVDSIGGNGVYLFMNKLWFDEAYYHNDNTKITITPYAYDMNGNKITGWTFDMTNEYYKSLQTGNVKQDMFKEDAESDKPVKVASAEELLDVLGNTTEKVVIDATDVAIDINEIGTAAPGGKMAYSIAGDVTIKNLTINGSYRGGNTLVFGGTSDQKIVFENCTFELGARAMGLEVCGTEGGVNSVVYNNCTFKGAITTNFVDNANGVATFNNCTFTKRTSGNDYVMAVGGTHNFNNCTFDYTGVTQSNIGTVNTGCVNSVSDSDNTYSTAVILNNCELINCGTRRYGPNSTLTVK